MLNRNFANSLTRQMRSVLGAIPDDPEAFKEFSKLPLEQQIKEFGTLNLSSGGQKGGGPIQTTQQIIKGVFKEYIQPAWKNIASRGEAIATTTNTIVTNYFSKLTDILSHAGIGNDLSEQHLANLLYGLAILATAYETGALAMVPGLTGQFMALLQHCIRMFPAIIPSAGVMGAAVGVAALYRYQEFPLGVYGIFAAVSTPFFSAAWTIGDAEFRAGNPNFGENMQAGMAYQQAEWLNTMAYYRDAGKAAFDRILVKLQPATNLTRALIIGWDEYVKASIEQAIRGGRLFTDDVNAVTAYINFLHDIGAGIRPTTAEAEAAQQEAMAQIADLLGPEGPPVDEQVVAGAMAMGIGLIEMDQGELNPDDEEQVAAVTEATAALLALTTKNHPPIPADAIDKTVEDLLNIADLGPETNMVLDNGAAAAPAPNNQSRNNNNNYNYSTAFTGGKPVTKNNLNAARLAGGRALRRRHRKTAKKSHKKKHTKRKAYKIKSRKSTKGKKGKKSKRHTKQRSYKGGSHDLVHS